jgi:hypothetical protein
MSAQKGVLNELFQTMYTYVTQNYEVLVVMYMYGGPLENKQHLRLYGKVTRLYGINI